MNKVILGIVIVLAVVVVGWFFMSQNAVAPESLTDSETSEQIETEGGAAGSEPTSLEGDMVDDIIVTYTAEGFEPKSVTINKGQTVRFVNQSNRNMWVGSDDHPTHTKYPITSEEDCLGSSFDSCRGLPVGEAWWFTFTETGTWGYHNHTQEGHRGTVIVQ